MNCVDRPASRRSAVSSLFCGKMTESHTHKIFKEMCDNTENTTRILADNIMSEMRNPYGTKPPPQAELRRRLPPQVELHQLPASYNGSFPLFLFSLSQSIPPYFSLDLSTQENYCVENKEFFGPFKAIRSTLYCDYNGEI